MRNYFLFKYLTTFLRKFIFIFLIINILLFFFTIKAFTKENVFTINEVKVEGTIDLNFSREKYLNKVFLNSFQILINRILLTRDLKKINDINLKKIRNLISNFQILEENYRKGKYEIKVKVNYNESKIKKFLAEKSISFSQPDNISAVFYPVLYINDEILNFSENFFYKNWQNSEFKNELINFILPLEDLDDIYKITEMKNKMGDINIETLVNKYNIKNYAFALMNYENRKLNVYLKTDFNNNKMSKNFFYNIDNINDELMLNYILNDLKIKITDIWKEQNLINFLMPLSVKIKFKHTNLKNLDELRNVLYKITMIDNYILEEFNTESSYFKIYYFGDPKKLRSELSKFGYQLKNDQGFWQVYLNE